MSEISVRARHFDPTTQRRVLSTYASGIAVITSGEGAPVGMTCQSFFSLSLDPPLVAFAPSKSSSTYPSIRANGTFCVNVLSAAQQHLSDQFARSGADKWRGVDWTPSGLGNPVIADVLSWIDCEIEVEHEAGDHFLVVGRVRDLARSDNAKAAPLLYHDGRYARALAG